MKKVAATSGQSVSLAIRFLAVGIALDGYCAGSDKELNFYSRPPKRISLAPLRLSEFAFAEYKSRLCMQEENAPQRNFFHRRRLSSRTVQPPGPALIPADHHS
jgi:hypothetical protein